MCGRTVLAADPEIILQRYHLRRWLNQERYRPSYNVAPTQQQPVMLQDAATGERVLRSMRWGLIFPAPTACEYAERCTEDHALPQPINARAESLIEGKLIFSAIKRRQRCVIIAEGYYEWLCKGRWRVPYYVRPVNKGLMLLAGVYSITRVNGEDVYSYAIVTTSAFTQLEFLHERMPVIFDDSSDALTHWLDPLVDWSEAVSDTLRPYAGEMEW
ncbi:hypothetical protein THASP1DRAFT_30939 [Thamnocephalis sphaerospora]|uniref:Abasic site processing protein n=1 Tax=Thamnocephalis sphaerospora TaxID=78915 RepID=A0A4P9XP97_9FUNG|nr:hypothetical protein THASP1DRAFT_30939 [Thamnocephalis sphaerospora]|eukprot:RKP07251.1 hypothetical protein THASP1DRAFT_30939 [Thamnocephalis sphaerospora]